VREGSLRAADVTAVLAWGWLGQHRVAPAPFDPDYDESKARAALEGFVAKALGAPPPALRLEVVCDLPAPALIERSAGAELLVVGARGLGGFRSLLLGSVSQHCLHHAPCPVAVVRTSAAGARARERVVVGVDGSADAARALAWAAEEARLRGAELVVVHAYLPPYAGDFAIAWDPGDEEEHAQVLLDDALAAVDTGSLPVPVEPVLAYDRAAPALLDAAEQADLVVVGSRGRGGFAGLLLGSVSHQVTHHAPCPVVVLRHDDGTPPQ
jgi:nucleotide-binding universal stress UspA family protein